MELDKLLVSEYALVMDELHCGLSFTLLALLGLLYFGILEDDAYFGSAIDASEVGGLHFWLKVRAANYNAFEHY